MAAHALNPQNDDRLMTITQCLKRAPISRSLFYQLIERGDIEYVRLGNRIFIRESVLDSWIQDNTHPARKA